MVPHLVHIRYIVKLSVDGAPLGACVSAGPSAGAPSPSTAAQRRAQRRLTREDNRYHSGGSARSNVTPQLPLSLPSFSRLFALQFNPIPPPPPPPPPFLPIFNLSFLTISHFSVIQNYRAFPYTIFDLLSQSKHSYRLRKSWWLIDIDNRIQTISTLLIAGVMTDCLSHSCDMREMRKKGEV